MTNEARKEHSNGRKRKKYVKRSGNWSDFYFSDDELPDGRWMAHLYNKTDPSIGMVFYSLCRLQAVDGVITEARSRGILPNTEAKPSA